ncbi:hypothetical protein J1614_004671 [Plenodomus biglobosus]|nr:hypothetical protein J1614_004671 [Plenodomus biglobosus]
MKGIIADSLTCSLYILRYQIFRALGSQPPRCTMQWTSSGECWIRSGTQHQAVRQRRHGAQCMLMHALQDVQEGEQSVRVWYSSGNWPQWREDHDLRCIQNTWLSEDPSPHSLSTNSGHT